MSCAAACGHNDDIDVLAAAGADMNHADSDGKTPLHRAAASHSVECVYALLRWGADETVVDRNGWDAAKHATRGNHDPMFCEEEARDKILDMLAIARADRAWRRRGWLTKMYAQCQRRLKQHPHHTAHLPPHRRHKTMTREQ